jgi:hypothetical protein
MSGVGNPFNVPHYVKAASPESLRLKLLENNLLLKAECQYFSIVYDSTSKEWVAWFYKVANEQPSLVKKVGK